MLRTHEGHRKGRLVCYVIGPYLMDHKCGKNLQLHFVHIIKVIVIQDALACCSVEVEGTWGKGDIWPVFAQRPPVCTNGFCQHGDSWMAGLHGEQWPGSLLPHPITHTPLNGQAKASTGCPGQLTSMSSTLHRRLIYVQLGGRNTAAIIPLELQFTSCFRFQFSFQDHTEKMCSVHTATDDTKLNSYWIQF